MFVPKCPISNIPALNQIMAAFYLSGHKPFSEPVIVSLLTDLYTVNRQPISHSNGWAMGCLLWGFGGKLTELLRHSSILINNKHPSDWIFHYDDVIMSAIASQTTSLTIVYSIVYSDADQRKHQSSASLAFVWGIHRRPVNSPHKWPVTRKMFPFDDVIISTEFYISLEICSIQHNCYFACTSLTALACLKPAFFFLSFTYSVEFFKSHSI